MASNRHLGRIVALQTLYEYEFRIEDGSDIELEAILKRNLERYKKAIGDTDFVKHLIDGVIKSTSELDEKLQPIAPDWPIESIARVDRSILRIGLFELLFSKEQVPPKVVINEAVELAKSFGSDNSSKFVNGVLGTAYRTLVEGGADDGKEQSKEASAES